MIPICQGGGISRRAQAYDVRRLIERHCSSWLAAVQIEFSKQVGCRQNPQLLAIHTEVKAGHLPSGHRRFKFHLQSLLAPIPHANLALPKSESNEVAIRAELAKARLSSQAGFIHHHLLIAGAADDRTSIIAVLNVEFQLRIVGEGDLPSRFLAPHHIRAYVRQEQSRERFATQFAGGFQPCGLMNDLKCLGSLPDCACRTLQPCSVGAAFPKAQGGLTRRRRLGLGLLLSHARGFGPASGFAAEPQRRQRERHCHDGCRHDSVVAPAQPAINVSPPLLQLLGTGDHCLPLCSLARWIFLGRIPRIVGVRHEVIMSDWLPADNPAMNVVRMQFLKRWPNELTKLADWFMFFGLRALCEVRNFHCFPLDVTSRVNLSKNRNYFCSG